MALSVEARNYEKSDKGAVICRLCPHNCRIGEGKRGICGVRVNDNGSLQACAYGIYPAVHLDPIEKKPLNHFLPGSRILSLGSVGCNLTCAYCQNWSLSRERPDGMDGYFLPPDVLLKNAGSRGSVGVAFTYNEPTINHEYLMEVAPELRKNGHKIVYVTNGHLSPEPWRELMEHSDAANIDVKAFRPEFYRDVAGGSLEVVLDNVKAAFEMGVHVELTYLVIPGHNDDKKEVGGFLDWVRKELSAEVPLHFNRFHPDHEMIDVPPTPVETLQRIRGQAKERDIGYVYIGNVRGREFNDTVCPECGSLAIGRDGYSIKSRMKEGRCSKCGYTIAGVWN